jgi:hypothetical protein
MIFLFPFPGLPPLPRLLRWDRLVLPAIPRARVGRAKPIQGDGPRLDPRFKVDLTRRGEPATLQGRSERPIPAPLI